MRVRWLGVTERAKPCVCKSPYPGPNPKVLETKQNIETAFQRAPSVSHQSKPETIEREARAMLAWNGTRTKRLGDIKAMIRFPKSVCSK